MSMAVGLSSASDHIVGALHEAHIAGAGVHHADSGEIMARDVLGQLPPGGRPTRHTLAPSV